MARKAEFIFVGDAASVIRAAKAAQGAVAKTATATEQSSKKVAESNDKASKSGHKFAADTEGIHVRVRRSFMGMTASAARMGGGIAAAYASIAGAKDAIQTTEELAHATISLHKNLGLSVTAASRWAAVARSRNVDSKALNQSFVALSKNVVKAGSDQDKYRAKLNALGTTQKDQETRQKLIAKGAGQSVDAFKKLGISQGELKKANFEETLKKTADGLKAMPAGAERAALSAKLFGRGWQTIVPILRGGSKAMDEQLALADKYGVTFKGKTVKSLEDLIKAQRESKFATMGLQTAFGTLLAPTLTKGTQAVNKFVVQMRDGTGQGGKFAKAARSVWESFKPLVGVLRDVGKYLIAHPKLIAAAVAAFAGFKVIQTVVATYRALKTAIIGLEAAKSAAKAFWLLDAAISANPIGIAVIAVAALTAGMVLAYRHSETFRKVINALFTAVKVGVGYALTPMVSALSALAGLMSGFLGLLSHIPSFGWAKDAQRAIDSARNATEGFVASLRKLPSSKRVDVHVRAVIDRGIKGGASLGASLSLGKGGDGLGNALARTVAARFPKTIGVAPSLGIAAGAASGALMGANSALAPVAGIASRFGLHVSSGLRQGAITSSGNVSYHSSGEAIDETGPASGMMRYFRYMKSTWGPRLAELIYTPGGAGIKNGKSFRYTGQVAADHFDHVHTAVDLGTRGVGIGGAAAGALAGMGDGLGKSQIMNLWTRAGGSAKAANLAASVALAESGGETTARGANTDGSVDRGLWQINSVHGKQSTFDPMANARAAVNISHHGSNWSPWVAYTTGRYKSFLNAPGAVSGGHAASKGLSAATLAHRRSGLEHHIQANLDRIDRLRNEAAATGNGKLGAAQRKAISDQIRHISVANRHLRQNISALPKAAKVKALVPQPSAYELALSGSDVQIAQAGTTSGVRDDVQAQVNRAGILKRRLDKINVALHKKDLTKATRKRLRDEKAGILGDLKSAGQTVADILTPAAVDDTLPEKLTSALSDIGLLEHAGILTGDQATQSKTAMLNAALGGKFGNLDARQIWEVMGELKDAQQATVDAMKAHTDALKENTDAQTAATAFAQQVSGTTEGSLRRSLVALVSGDIAMGVVQRGALPGAGNLSRV